MKLFDASPSVRWLFCPTHPDDELAVCAFIRRLRDAGAEVFINWTHATPVRRLEAVRAAALMGVPEENLSFMPGEDGAICDQMPELFPLFRSLIDRARPDRVVCAAFEQGHLDHDATHCLVRKAFCGPVLEWPMYHPYTRRLQTMGRFSDPSGEEVLMLTSSERRFKRFMSKQYPSQNIRPVLIGYHLLCSLRLRPARLYAAERLRLCAETDYTAPAVPTRFLREVCGSHQWRGWLAAYQRFSAESPKHSPGAGANGPTKGFDSDLGPG